MLRIAVCDKEEQVCDYLESLILKTVEADIVKFCSGEELLKSDRDFAVYFLEIELGKLNGLDTAAIIREKSQAIIIFVTSHTDYVFRAFDVEAFHYLLKPINETRFQQILERAVEEIRRRQPRQPLIIRSGGTSRSVLGEDILYAENAGRKIVLHMQQEKFEYYSKMEDLERLLGGQFYRCHRGYLVNLSEVREYDTGRIILKNGEEILMARQKYHGFEEAYFVWMRR